MIDDENPTLLQAQQRMAALAVNLSRMFDPMQAACLLAAAALTLVRTAHGRDAAAQFFEGISEEIAADGITVQ